MFSEIPPNSAILWCGSWWHFNQTISIFNYKGDVQDRSNGRYVVSYNNQAISLKSLKQGLIHPSQTNIYVKTKVKKPEQVRIIPKNKAYVIEVVDEQFVTQSSLPEKRIAALDLGLNNLATLSSNLPNYQPKIYDGRALKSEINGRILHI